MQHRQCLVRKRGLFPCAQPVERDKGVFFSNMERTPTQHWMRFLLAEAAPRLGKGCVNYVRIAGESNVLMPHPPRQLSHPPREKTRFDLTLVIGRDR